MSAEVIILFAGDKGWRDCRLASSFAEPSRVVPFNVSGREPGGNEGGHFVDVVAKCDQAIGGGGVIDGQAANITGLVKKFCRKLVAVPGVHCRAFLDLETAARMGGNDLPVDGNKTGILP